MAVTPLADALTLVKPRLATDGEILRFHTPEYLATVKRVSAETAGGLIGHEMHIGPRGFEIASLSLGGVLVAVEEVMAGRLRSAYALVRPPGHHAERDVGMGFCCFSNVSLAAVHAIEVCGARRVAILDWDVHHGACCSVGRRCALSRRPSPLRSQAMARSSTSTTTTVSSSSRSTRYGVPAVAT